MQSAVKKIMLTATVLTTVTLLLNGCGDTVEKADKSIKERQADIKLNTLEINQQYFTNGDQLIAEFQQQTRLFNQQLNRFIELPTDESLRDTQQAWLTLHNNWHKLDFYVYAAEYLGNQLPALQSLINNIHSTPAAENLIDSDKRNTGIIKNLEYTITPEGLLGIHNAQQDDSSVIGLHAIAFILWNNSLSDFQQETTLSKAEQFRGLSLNDLPNTRRLTYLKSNSVLLEAFSKELTQTWSDSEQIIKSLPEDQKKQLLLGISRKVIENIHHNLNHNHSPQNLYWIQNSIASIDGKLLKQETELKQLQTLAQGINDATNINSRSVFKKSLAHYISQSKKKR